MRPLEALRSQADTSPAAKQAWERVQAAQQEQTLRSALHDWLYRTPINGSSPGDPGDAEVVTAFVDAYVDAHGRAQDAAHDRLTAAPGTDAAQTSERMAEGTRLAKSFLHADDVVAEDRERVRRLRAGLLFVESYRDLPLLAWPRLLVDAVVELEENLVLWRTRHARMVERVIGRRVGTGGSSGVDYLDATARYRIFTELWTVRTILLAREHLPPLTKPEFYGFATPSDQGEL
jgi:tryptophan 2,3-dioxygenase